MGKWLRWLEIIEAPDKYPEHYIPVPVNIREGIEFGLGDTIDLSVYQWSG